MPHIAYLCQVKLLHTTVYSNVKRVLKMLLGFLMSCFSGRIQLIILTIFFERLFFFAILPLFAPQFYENFKVLCM